MRMNSDATIAEPADDFSAWALALDPSEREGVGDGLRDAPVDSDGVRVVEPVGVGDGGGYSLRSYSYGSVGRAGFSTAVAEFHAFTFAMHPIKPDLEP